MRAVSCLVLLLLGQCWRNVIWTITVVLWEQPAMIDCDDLLSPLQRIWRFQPSWEELGLVIAFVTFHVTTDARAHSSFVSSNRKMMTFALGTREVVW